MQRAQIAGPAIAALGAVVFLTSYLGAQATATIHGHVHDASGGAVAGVEITLESQADTLRLRAETDAAGSYRLVNLPYGAYVLQAHRTGFDSVRRVVQGRSNVPVEVDLELSIAAERESITVAAAGATIDPEQSGTHAQMSAMELERVPSGTGARGLEAALVAFPGFAKDANGAIHPRGAHNQMTFVVDGMPIADQLTGAFANSLDPAIAQTVELSTGNISAEFGGKTGAVASITTRSGMGSGRRFSGSFAPEMAQFDLLSQNTQVAGERGRWGYSASATTLKSHRFLDQVSRDNLHNGGNSERVFTRVDWQASANDAVRLTTIAGRSSFELANLRSQQAAGQDQRQLLRDASAALGWVHTLSPRATVDVTGSWRIGEAHLFSSPGDLPITARQTRQLTTVSGAVKGTRVGTRNTSRFGFDAQRFPVREQFEFAITDFAFNIPGSEGFNPHLTAHDLTRGGRPFRFRDRRAGSFLGAFWQEHVRLGGLTLDLGLRADRYSLLVRGGQWQPRVGAAYAVQRTQTVFRLSYNRLFQTPPNENLLISASTAAAALAPDGVGTAGSIRPERQNVFELGLQQGLGPRVSLNFAAYYKNARDQQDNNNFLNTGVVFPIALSRIQVRGAEARLVVRPVHGAGGSLSVTRSRAVSSPPFTGGLFLGNEAVESLSQGPFIIDHDQGLSVHGTGYWNHRRGWWVAGTARHDSGLVSNPSDPTEVARDTDYSDLLPYVDLRSNPARIRPRTILDGMAGYRASDANGRARWEAGVEVTNISNRTALYNFQSIFVGTRLVAPRTVGVRLRWMF